ncbi:hypothetical protein N9V27_01520 [bacterium]|nr:hypothetical protein [bacterium]
MSDIVTNEVLEAAIEEVAKGETFKFVGFATSKKGRGKLRFSNDKRRTRTLVRNGFTDVKFIELPNPMNKEEILASTFVQAVSPQINSEIMQKEVDLSA